MANDKKSTAPKHGLAGLARKETTKKTANKASSPNLSFKQVAKIVGVSVAAVVTTVGVVVSSNRANEREKEIYKKFSMPQGDFGFVVNGNGEEIILKGRDGLSCRGTLIVEQAGPLAKIFGMESQYYPAPHPLDIPSPAERKEYFEISKMHLTLECDEPTKEERALSNDP